MPETTLRAWGETIPKNASQRMGRSRAEVQAELRSESAARKLALELAGGKVESESVITTDE